MSHLVKLLPTKLEDQGPYPVIGNFDCAMTFWSLFKRWKGGLDGPLTNSIRIYLLVTLRFYSINSAQVQLNSSYFVFLYQTNTHEHYFSRHSQTLCLSLTPKRAFSHSNEKLWLLERQKKRKNESERERERWQSKLVSWHTVTCKNLAIVQGLESRLLLLLLLLLMLLWII